MDWEMQKHNCASIFFIIKYSSTVHLVSKELPTVSNIIHIRSIL